MMQSSYVMGSRLVVHDAKYEPLHGSSSFLNIKDDIRSHSASYVDISSLSSSHYASDAFTDKEYNLGTPGEYIMYFPGGITYLEAVQYFDYLVAEDIVSDSLLTMKFEIMLYSNDARMGNLIIFNFY